MHRTDGVGTRNTLPTANAAGATVGYFENATPGPGVNPTYFDPDWANAVQEEIVNVILAAGLTLTKGTYTQLLTALRTLGRIKLAAALHLYVSPSGNDANTGLTIGSPFLTIGKALNVLYNAYDLNGFQPTIHLADGTYTATVSIIGLPAGASMQSMPVNILGNTTTPANVVIDVTNGSCFAFAQTFVFLDGMTLRASGTAANQGIGISAASASVVSFGGHMVFGACATTGMLASSGAQISSSGNNYLISGGGNAHETAIYNGVIVTQGSVVTISGTPAFSTGYAVVDMAGSIQCASQTFSGAATGPRYSAQKNGVIDTNGGGASYLPGNSAGSATTGLYV